MKKCPAFTQIVTASVTTKLARNDGWPVGVMGAVLYGLDKKGRVWRKLPSVRADGYKEQNQPWALVETEAL